MRWKPALLLSAAALLSGGVGDDPAGEVPFEVPVDGRVEASVDGTDVTVFAGPGMPSDLALSRAFATRVFGDAVARRVDHPDTGFKLISIGLSGDKVIGPVRIPGRLRRVSLLLDGQATKTTARWSQVDAYAFGDALAGPYAFPQPIVRFHLRAPTGAETMTVLPLAPKGEWWLATTMQEVAGKQVKFAFAPQFATTVASAAAGAAISAEARGVFSQERTRVLISSGVERPVRSVRVARPFVLGPLRMDRLMVRVADYGSTASIVDPTEAEMPAANEMVVKGKRRAGDASYVVYVGADALSGCSSITYDKPAREIRLSCR